MKGFGSHKESTNKKIKNSKVRNINEQMIHKALKSHSEGNIKEATKYYQSFIDKGLKDYRVFLNYGAILKDLGKLHDAEKSTRKAIELKPDLTKTYFSLSTLQYSKKNNHWPKAQ